MPQKCLSSVNRVIRIAFFVGNTEILQTPNNHFCPLEKDVKNFFLQFA